MRRWDEPQPISWEASSVDWRALKLEGEAYLRRARLPDHVATWAVALLFVQSYGKWMEGKVWNPRRVRWEFVSTLRLGEPSVFDRNGEVLRYGGGERSGRPLPRCMAPNECADCGEPCSFNARRCQACWDKIRPRKAGRSQ